ncbi:MAG: extracellular solute-binding protein [Candidatus Promineifilaceae bacterium]
MSVDFDWQVSDDEFEETEHRMRSTPPWVRWGLMSLFLVVMGAIGGGLWWQVYSAELQLKQSTQFVLDLEHQAYLDGDGDLLFSVYDPDDLAFQSAQLRPDQQAVHAAGVEVTHAEQHEDIVWANASWEQDGIARQRITFFEQTENGLRHIATDLAYWGDWNETAFDWGALRLRAADVQWATPISKRIKTALLRASVINRIGEPPTVVIRDDFEVSTLANVINYPSPRLLGLDAEGALSEAYLDSLEQTISRHFRPIKLRFAVPRRASSDVLIQHLERFAEAFSAEHTSHRFTFEFVIIDPFQDPAEWLPTIDAALWPVTEAAIKQGHLYDLTQLASNDAAFDHGDFYDQAWRGAWWDERMWMIPWSTSLNLTYYDRQPFRDFDVPQPESTWTWEELDASLVQLVAAQPNKRSFIDPSRDTLYAYAYAQDTSCYNREDCVPALTKKGVTAALAWYRKLVVEDQVAFDLSALPTDEARLSATLRALSAHKDVAVWIDTPMLYEYQLGLQTTVVVPQMPISAETPLVLPVHVNGMLISQATEYPYWTWQWIKFLSHQNPPSDLRRSIPARPSVARQSEFWEWMPEPLAKPMQAALPYSRPMLIGDERYLSWEMLAGAVQAEVVGDISAEPVPLKWFSP